MNLPQNKQKSDGAIAQSFSQELGLNLDFKTGRKAQIQSSEHIGEKAILMDNEKLLVVVNRQNTIIIWDLVQKCQLHTFEIAGLEIKTYYKYNEKELLLIGNKEIGIFNLDSGIYSKKIQSEKEIAAHDVSSKYGILAFYQLDKKSKDNCKVVFYKLEDFTLFNEINCSDFISYPAAEIEIAQSTKTFCLRDSIRAYIYDIDTFIKIHTFNIDELLFQNFLDYKFPGKILYSTIGKSVCEYNVDNEYPINHLFECGDKVQVSNQIILSARYNNDSVLLTTYRLSNYEKIGSVKINASSQAINFQKLILGYETISNIKHINLSGTKIIGYEFAKDKPGSLFFYNLDLSEKTNIEYTTSLNLKQFNSKEQLFCFDDLAFDMQKELFIKTPFKTHNQVKGNWANAGYYVSIEKEPDMKYPFVIFYNIKTGKTSKLHPHKHLYIEDNNSMKEVIIEYKQDVDLWIIKCLYHGILLYDVKENEVLKSRVFRSSSMQEQKYTNERDTIFSSDFKYALTYEKDLQNGSTLFLFDTESQKLIAEYKTKGLIYHCFLNNNNKRIIILELFQNEETKLYDIQVSILDFKLNLIDSFEFGFEEKYGFKGSNIVFAENENILYFSLWLNKKKKIFSFDINRFVEKELTEITSTRDDKLVLSSDESILVYSNEKCNGAIELNINNNVISIKGNSENEFSFSADGNLLFVSDKDKIEVFQTKSFEQIGNIYVEANRYFHFELLPDKTSPNGWFYTNNSEKINVFKTKMDGSEPELLPVDNEDRHAFIKHHNRKDIVMNKLFEPEKYAEFAKLNASAEAIAKQDMAIELSKVETKKLKEKNRS